MEMFNDYELFKRKFYDHSLIDLNLYKEKQMKRRITSLVERYGHKNYLSFLARIKLYPELYDIFINFLTINVSEFYRNPNQWVLFEDHVLNEIYKDRKKSEIKIWSSACSTGDEPYTVVMILNKYIPLSEIKVIATDIDKGAIEKAKNGLYTFRSLKDLPNEFLVKHFKSMGNDTYEISEDVRNCVEFSQLNLLEDPYPKDLDIIICRNVLIYFTEQAKDNIVKKFTQSLNPNGIIFIGSTEQIMNYNQLNLAPIDTFFYQKRD